MSEFANETIARTPYGDLVIGQIPRLLSHIDRNPYSPTYGCGDRAFWHYRTMIDYAAPLHQEVALTLAIAWQQKRDANPYWQSESLRETACAAMRFWSTLQHADGSFPEFYPGERSFVATAFTAYSISEALLRLGEQVVEEDRLLVLAALARAAEWLHRHRDIIVVNHTAGAIAMLQNMRRLTGEDRYVEYREAKVEDLLSHQHEEGWFYEYGGADPAYLSLAVDYLAKDYRHSRDERLGQALHRALDFMRYFQHPDGSFGGEYGSRNAKYLMPHGLELLAAESPAAAQLAANHADCLARGTVVNPATMDDRYTAFFLNKYSEAWADYQESAAPVPEPQCPHRLFAGAGLLVRSGPSSYTVVGLSKHGILKSYATSPEPKALYSDTGYFAEFTDGTIGTTQWLDLEADYRLREEGELLQIDIAGQMARFNYSLPLVRYLVPFRLFLKLFGSFGRLMDYFGKKVIHRMIIARQPQPLHFERNVRLGPEEMLVTDRLRLVGSKRLARLGRSAEATAIHVASSRYAQAVDSSVGGRWDAPNEYIESLNQGRVLEVVSTVEFSGHRANSVQHQIEDAKEVAVA
jgi:hypothetical protein